MFLLKKWSMFSLVLVSATIMAACAGGGGGGAAGDGGAAGGGGAAGAGGAAGGGGGGDVAKGQTVYMGTCAACHGPSGTGVTGLGKNLAEPSEWMQKQTDATLLAMIKTGRSSGDPENTTKVDMPPKGGNPALSEEDLTNVVAFIRSIQK